MLVVTGATGHIGNVLIRELVTHGQTVRALVLPDDDCRPFAGLEVEIARGDVTDLKSLESAFAGADTVFHLAGIVTIMPGMEKLLERVNVSGVRNVVTACRTCGVRRLVYTSSVHAIAEPPHGTIIDESQPFDPDRVLGDYARSKARATLLLLDEVRKRGLDAVICFSSKPTVDTKYPGDHTTFSFQYTLSNHANFFLSLLAVYCFISPITSLTAYFGGITTNM